MKSKLRTLGILVAVGGLAALTLTPDPVAARESTLPGMCRGRTDAGLHVHAHAVPRRSGVPRYILNVNSDENGDLDGALAVGRGPLALHADQWCRLWQHRPGQPYGECGMNLTEDATNVHAVGFGRIGDEEVLVRTDVRETSAGRFFRVRYRTMPGGHDHYAGLTPAAHDEDGCGGGWTKIPAEGWAPLDQLRVWEEAEP